MSEILLPINREGGLNSEQRIKEFAQYVLDVYQGKGINFQLSPENLQSELEKGYGAPGEYSYIQTSLLFRRIAKEERPLFLKAIGTLIEDPSVPEYTKAALLHHHTLPDFITIVDPSVGKLLDMLTTSSVLEESLEEYFIFRELEIIRAHRSTKAQPKPKEKILNAQDYKLTKKQLRFSPNRSRTILDDWVMGYDIHFGKEKHYAFYPFGKPCDLKYCYLDLDLLPTSVRVTWYDNCTLQDILPVANLFLKTTLSKEEVTKNAPGWQYDLLPGIYIHPDSDYLRHLRGIYVPFTKVQPMITYDLLEQELRRHEEFINYTLDECSLHLLSPKGNQLDFQVHIPDDPARHPINLAFPQESKFWLNLSWPITTDEVVSIIKEGSQRALPIHIVEKLLKENFGE